MLGGTWAGIEMSTSDLIIFLLACATTAALVWVSGIAIAWTLGWLIIGSGEIAKAVKKGFRRGGSF